MNRPKSAGGGISSWENVRGLIEEKNTCRADDFSRSRATNWRGPAAALRVPANYSSACVRKNKSRAKRGRDGKYFFGFQRVASSKTAKAPPPIYLRPRLAPLFIRRASKAGKTDESMMMSFTPNVCCVNVANALGAAERARTKRKARLSSWAEAVWNGQPFSGVLCGHHEDPLAGKSSASTNTSR